jgi:protein-S-isoprenylcysteine O-methyltransferase Ste14
VLECETNVPASTSDKGEGRRLPAHFLDWSERLLVLALYVWLVVRLLTNYWESGNVISLLLAPSEGLVVLFMLLRRPAIKISGRPHEWLIAIAATCIPMLVRPDSGAALVPVLAAVFLLLFGTLVQIHAKLALGRSIGCVPAQRKLQVSGPYRLVRHPMYLGYLLGHLGFLVSNATSWNLAVYLLCYGLQVPRMLAEERLLGLDPQYRDYQAAVRFRLIPGVF